MITEAGLVVGEGYRRGVVTGGKDEEREDGEDHRASGTTSNSTNWQ